MNKIYNRIAVLGSAFGDEGKGRVVHDFSQHYDWVVRFSGSGNCGHVVYKNNKKYVHNYLPSVDYTKKQFSKSWLGANMVIDLEALKNEVKKMSDDFHMAHTVYVDLDAFVILPEHKEIDAKTNGHIGTTLKGVGPCYADKVARKGLTIHDCMNSGPENLKQAINDLKDMGVKFSSVLSFYKEFKKSSIIFEGSQGILLDVNHGSYPFVTSSSASTAGILESGFAFCQPEHVYGVTKPYLTRVGEGPLRTQLEGEEAEKLQLAGNEVGSVTGRKRRVGWLDAPSLKYAALKGGIDSLIVTKMDVLNYMKEIKMSVEHQGVDGCFSISQLKTFTPVYKTLPWSAIGKNGDLTQEHVRFFNLITEKTDLKISYYTFGIGANDYKSW